MTTLSERQPLHGFNPPASSAAAAGRGSFAASVLRLLPWAFALFSCLRLVSYLPVLWAIHSQGDTSQHSLIAWLTWAGANATMAACMYEKNGLRLDRTVVVNAGNTVMCLVTAMLIAAYRW